MKLKKKAITQAGPLFLLLSGFGLTLHAEPLHEHVDTLIAKPDLSLSQVTDHAFERAPERDASTAYEQMARARSRNANGWLAGVPSLGLRYESDSVDQDRGYRDAEISLTLPMRRWGQKDALESLAGQSDLMAQRYPEMVRLEISGQVRESVWALKTAFTELELATQALAIARELEAKVQRQLELGSAARAEVMAATRQRLLQETALMRTEAEWALEQQHYQHITGLANWPLDIIETTTHEPGEHPLLATKRLEMEQASAQVQSLRQSGSGQPELTLAGRSEKAERGQDAELFMALELSLPFGGRNYSGVALAESMQALADTRSGYQRLELTLEARREEMAVRLQSLESRLPLSREQLALAERQYEMDQKAYESGVMDLLELLRTQSSLLDIRREHQLMTIDIGRSRAELNQISGISL